MEMLELRLRFGVEELLDAAEDIELLLDREGDGEMSPAFRDLLFSLDEAITGAYRNHPPANARVIAHDAVPAL